MVCRERARDGHGPRQRWLSRGSSPRFWCTPGHVAVEVNDPGGGADAYASWSGWPLSPGITWMVRSSGPRPASQCLIRGYGQVETLSKAVRVDPEQLSRGVQDRAARGAGQQRSGVLQAAGYPAAARAAESPLDAGDEPERHPQPAPARVGQ